MIATSIIATPTKTEQLIKELKARELFYQTTDHNQTTEINAIYCGFDATALSLQVGNLLCLAYLRLVHKHDIHTIAILGGATSHIGDPIGKNETRKKLDVEQVLSLIHISEPTRRTPIPYAVFCLKK
mgnify:CR=1 FL=1